MRDRLTGLLEKADLAVASCRGVVSDTAMESLLETVRAVRTRLSYPDDVLVVALAGGTGSGKSSLFNALVGDDLADVGGVRPTTSHPEAAMPAATAAALSTYLDRLGIQERHLAELSGICLLDLPDTDSVEIDHRHRVDVLLPLVDVVVWVTDPEKYRDARLHNEYLRPLARYSEQMVYVLNQADRLSEAQSDRVLADFRTALAEDGISRPGVILTAAAPPAGPPMGIETLAEALERSRGQGEVLYRKLLTDIAGTVADLETAIGPGVEFDEPAAETVGVATAALVTDDLERATEVLTEFLDDLASRIGGPTAVKVERLASDVPQHVQRIATQTKPEVTRGWFGRKVGPAPRDVDQVRRLLNEGVIRPVRAVLAKRALAQASIADLAVEVVSLGSGSPR